MASLVPDTRVPEVYVLWHPDCAVGESLARQIHRWLRPGNGQGPQVFYRSLPAPESPPGGLPPPLPGEARPLGPFAVLQPTSLQIVLPLIDENMIVDPTWRHWLAQLARLAHEDPAAREIIPIALDSTAFNAPAPLSERNFLRPMGGADEAARSRSLLKQLTEALCRRMLGTPRRSAALDAGAPAALDVGAPKITIFLSHAKGDGTVPARRIRDHIYSQTQLAAFYDENDIPYGSAFARVLDASIQDDRTVALIAVRSAQYARRPWCRRELSLFRRPRRVPGSGNRWRLSPVLAVDALEPQDATIGIPELGNAPLVRWSPDVPHHEEQIVTTLLRDALLCAVHTAIGNRIAADDPGRVVINWLPDPTTLLAVLREQPPGEVTVHHPGRGLSGLELDILAEMFPQLELQSFEATLT